MRRIAVCVTTCIGLALMAGTAIGEQNGITLDAHQKDLVDKVSSYFSAIHTLQGSFLQTSSDNQRMKGKFYVQRPGRFRFDYARPSIVSVDLGTERWQEIGPLGLSPGGP